MEGAGVSNTMYGVGGYNPMVHGAVCTMVHGVGGYNPMVHGAGGYNPMFQGNTMHGAGGSNTMYGAGGYNPMVQGNIINFGAQVNTMQGAGGSNTMYGAGRYNPMVQGDIKADPMVLGDIKADPMVKGDIKAKTGAIINLGNIGNINLGAEEHQVGMDTTKSVLETGKSVLETGTSILATGKLLYDIFGEKIGDIRNLEKKMEQLNHNAQYLFAKKHDLEKRIKKSPNVATEESMLWLKDVKKLEAEVQSIKRCSNVFSRHTLGKRVDDVIEKITDLTHKQPELKETELKEIEFLMHCLRELRPKL